ncbi:alpha-1-antitrypsin homolog isoform X2 [Tachysurus fulvidraco]|nr:alpha-1-antitrypsin homolog isoform X2 [Tachysurus fulvidraco]
MWQKTCLTFALLVIMTSAEHHEGHNHTEHSADHHLEDHTANNTDFAFALYEKLSNQADAKGKNIFFSPLSISMALSMLALGAKGETHSQIFSTLGYSSFTEDQVNEAYEHLLHMLDHSQEAMLLETGGGLAVRDGFKPADKFLKDLQHFYHAEAFTVDFSKPDIAVQEVNKFIAKKTRDTITDMVKSLDQDTIMVLINYIYFRGKWQKPFQEDATHKADFYVDKNKKVTVDMMKLVNEQHNVHITRSVTIVQLPYIGNASMLIVLPAKGKMKEVEKQITSVQLRKWLDKCRVWSVDLYMPKFSISASASLGDSLKEMGIVDAFSDKADFSGMSEDTELKVSNVLHKVILNVDEKGTEAVGSTTVEIINKSMPLTIKINRPFLLYIWEESLKSLVFMGRIVNPAL